MTAAIMLSLWIIALWWLLLSLPCCARTGRGILWNDGPARWPSFRRLGRTLANVKREKNIFLFLLAFFFYIDGVYTIIDMATAYGTALGFDTAGLLLALLVLQVVAFPCSIFFLAVWR